MLDWFERNDVRYIVGLARNAVLEREVQVACEVARDGFEATGRKSRLFTELRYGARTWRRERQVRRTREDDRRCNVDRPPA